MRLYLLTATFLIICINSVELKAGAVYPNSEKYLEKTAISNTTTISQTNKSSSTRQSLTLVRKRRDSESCACTYKSDDSNLIAFVGTTQLSNGDKVNLNDKVKFHCQRFGYLRVKGVSEIKCGSCRSWDSSDFPECVEPKTGDTIIQPKGDYMILPGGIIGVPKGGNLIVRCVSVGVKEPPIWAGDLPQEVRSKMHLPFGEDKGEWNSLLKITDISTQQGKWMCYMKGYPILPTYIQEIDEDPKHPACTCTYRSDDNNLIAFVGTKQLSNGDKVNYNDKVKLHCKRFGYLRVKGASEIKCKGCGLWDSSELPECVEPKTGDTIIEPIGDYTILPGGVIGVPKGKPLTVRCVSKGVEEPPIWAGDLPQEVRSNMHLPFGEKNGEWYSLLIITDISTQQGKWMCYMKGFPILPTYVKEIDARMVNCSKLDDKDFFIFYDKEQAVNSSAVFFCKDWHKKLDGSNTATCLPNGRWSRDPPKCKTICEDPGHLSNGEAKPIGKVEDVFVVGSSIRYSCKSLHYLKGAESISCLMDGTWSDQIPTCIKVNACEEPPVPIGGFVEYIPPLKTSTQQRAAVESAGIMGSRAARVPLGSSDTLPVTLLSTRTEEANLPPGLHGIGVRAVYDCVSRYYKRIGSRMRRCQENGEWSGRPATCLPVCGRSDSPRSPFVVNGNATDVGQWPWQVGLARYYPAYKEWSLHCGASLLNEQWVITAAHCLTYSGTSLTRLLSTFKVYFGKYHRQDSKDDESVQTRKIREVHVHPDYDPISYDTDIALLQLDSPVELNSRVQPVCLPTERTTRKNLVEGKRGVVTGWGKTEKDSLSETLRQAVVPVVEREKCEEGYEESGIPLTVSENMFCAGYEDGSSDSCNGDSGGPMVFLDDSSKERKWVLEGIVSWGSKNGCGKPKQYGGYTTVSNFLDWIHLYF